MRPILTVFAPDYVAEQALLELSRMQRAAFVACRTIRPLPSEPRDAGSAVTTEVTTMDHDWIASTLGHGESMCSRCKITILEASALGVLYKCEVVEEAGIITEVVEAKWWAVAIYECNQSYGGPEEGGWYYNCGELCTEVAPVVCTTQEEVRAAMDKLGQAIEDRGMNAGRYPMNSVLCRGFYQVCVHDEALPPHFPQQRPHYE